MQKSKFTNNKQTVRDLQAETIQKYLKNRLGNLTYFGLPSEEIKDIIDWKPFFSKFIVVERGYSPNFYEKQHILMVNASKNNIL